MALPALIHIEPVQIDGTIRVAIPGSKSLTNRALILAALGDGVTTLRGGLWSEDTQVMTTCLRRLGFEVVVEPEPDEPANRTFHVEGRGGQIPNGGTESDPLELEVGNAGTAARFLTALTCLGNGSYRLHGVPRMHERPQAPLFKALRQLGYKLDSPSDRLPVVVHGRGPRSGRCEIPLEGSSQFASALLLAASTGGWEVTIAPPHVSSEAETEEEAPYVRMTEALIRTFPTQGGVIDIEPDASSGSYFWAADWLLRHPSMPVLASTAISPSPDTRRIDILRWPDSGWQIDAEFPKFLPLPERISRKQHLADSILTAMILAPFASYPVHFEDLGRLRVQECERVYAMRTGLEQCGARVSESGDTLTIWPGKLHGAEIETYEDHRIAMCFATLGLQVDGMKIRNPACVKKTFPNFFQKLATPFPAGLGVRFREHAGSPPLAPDQLVAS